MIKDLFINAVKNDLQMRIKDSSIFTLLSRSNGLVL